MKTPHESQVERAKAPEPPGQDLLLCKLPHKHTCFLAITAYVQTICTSRRPELRYFSVARLPGAPPSKRIGPWDRTYVLLLPGASNFTERCSMVDAPTTEGITLKSLPRTGRATLMASSSTGEQRHKPRLATGWSVLRPLGRLAPALPGPLHPTSTRQVTFFMLAP